MQKPISLIESPEQPKAAAVVGFDTVVIAPDVAAAPFVMIPRALDLRSDATAVEALADDIRQHTEEMGVDVGLIDAGRTPRQPLRIVDRPSIVALGF